MPDVSLNDVVEMTLGYRSQGQQCLLVRHYFCANLPADRDYEANLDDLMNAWLIGPTPVVAPLQAMQHADVNVNFLMAQKIGPTRWFYKRSAQNSDGTHPGVEPMPPNSAVTVSLQTETPGRGRSGSAHVGGLTTQTYTDAGFVDPDFLPLMQDFGDALITGIGGVAPNNYWKPCCYSGPGPGGINRVIAATPQTTMRVMRRRTVGLGI